MYYFQFVYKYTQIVIFYPHEKIGRDNSLHGAQKLYVCVYLFTMQDKKYFPNPLQQKKTKLQFIYIPQESHTLARTQTPLITLKFNA
jgi:hypothetical protein